MFSEYPTAALRIRQVDGFEHEKMQRLSFSVTAVGQNVKFEDQTLCMQKMRASRVCLCTDACCTFSLIKKKKNSIKIITF